MSYNKRLSRKLRRYKEQIGCENCGYNANGLALDFAHTNPNNKSPHMYVNRPRGNGMGVLVGRITKYGTPLHRQRMKELKEEIRKCKVLCKNCHVIETYNNNEMHNGYLLSNKRKGILTDNITTLEEFFA
jgi:hypothetical protein